MSAKTRQNDALQQRDKITGLYANAYDLLLKGKRDVLQIHHLAHALQLFKENRLAGSLEKSKDEVPVDVQERLSILVSDILPTRTARHVQYSYGVKYVGEMLLYCALGARSPQRTQWVTVSKTALADLGLPVGFNVRESGWIPPYATDEKILSIWTKRIHEVSRQCPSKDRGGCISVGEFFRKNRYRGSIMVDQIARNYGIHRGIYVPPSWEAPAPDSECCRTYLNINKPFR